VVDVGLHLVEILTLLLLEAILAVKDKLESVELTGSLLGESHSATTGTDLDERSTNGRGRDEGVGSRDSGGVGLEDDLGNEVILGEVPERRLGGSVGERPHELLDGVIVGETHLLGRVGINSVNTSVLNLLDEVLVSFLRKTPTLLGVKVDVVGPDLEDRRVEEIGEIGR